MIDLGALKIGVKVDKDTAISDLNSLQGVAETTQSKFSKFGSALKTGAMVGGAVLASATTAALGMATNASVAVDRIDKMSQKLGMSKEGFQEWDYILGQNGISIDGLSGGMKTLTNMTDDLGKGAKTATDSFGRLGLSYDDLKGKSQEDIFNLTVQKLMEVEDSTERAALANDLLGRSGAELAPLLNQGAEGAEELRKRAHELGIVLSDDAVDAGVVFGDTMDDLKKSFGNVVTQIGVELMPMFQQLMDWVLAHMPEIKEVASTAFKFIGDAVKVAWDIFANYLLPVFEAVLSWVKENWPLISGIIKTAFTVVKTVWDTVLSPVLSTLMDIFGVVLDIVSKNFPAIQTIFENVFGAIGGIISTAVKAFEGLITIVKKAIEYLKNWKELDAQASKNTETYKSSAGGRRDGYTHAAGIDYVPYDGYVATLHKGERVVPALEANKPQTINHSGTIKVQGVNNQGELTAVVDIVMNQLRREVRLA